MLNSDNKRYIFLKKFPTRLKIQKISITCAFVYVFRLYMFIFTNLPLILDIYTKTLISVQEQSTDIQPLICN